MSCFRWRIAAEDHDDENDDPDDEQELRRVILQQP